MATEEIKLPVAIEEEIAALAKFFWSVHPKLLDQRGITREQLYIEEMRDFASAIIAAAPGLNAPKELKRLVEESAQYVGELRDWMKLDEFPPRNVIEGIVHAVRDLCAQEARIESHHAFWCQVVDWFPTARDQKVASTVAQNIAKKILQKIRSDMLYEKFLSQGVAREDMKPLEFTYKNWQGVTARRRVYPIRHWHGKTEWHPEPQWLLKAWDLDKNAARDFAVVDMIYD